MLGPILLTLAAKHGIPMISGMISEQLQMKAVKKMHALDLEKISKTQQMMNKKIHGKNIQLSEGFLPNESIEDLGRRKWEEYHSKVDSLPENASEWQVKEALGQIVDNIQVYPCETCKKNALTNLKTHPILTATTKTKQEAQQGLCNFHNAVRTMLKKEITHNCDQFAQ